MCIFDFLYNNYKISHLGVGIFIFTKYFGSLWDHGITLIEIVSATWLSLIYLQIKKIN